MTQNLTGGEDGLDDSGISVSRLIPIPGLFLEATGQVFRGDSAVFNVINWPEGEFEIDFSGVSERITTTRSTTGLLMEALRLLDEAGGDRVES